MMEKNETTGATEVPSNTSDRWLDMKQVQAHLGGEPPPDPSTVYRWIRDYGFPVGKELTPGTKRWLQSKVEAWLEKRPDTLRASRRRKDRADG
jgi:predicted DNA-binding transcriptional regulator AlpA